MHMEIATTVQSSLITAIPAILSWALSTAITLKIQRMKAFIYTFLHHFSPTLFLISTSSCKGFYSDMTVTSFASHDCVCISPRQPDVSPTLHRMERPTQPLRQRQGYNMILKIPVTRSFAPHEHTFVKDAYTRNRLVRRVARWPAMSAVRQYLFVETTRVPRIKVCAALCLPVDLPACTC